MYNPIVKNGIKDFMPRFRLAVTETQATYARFIRILVRSLIELNAFKPDHLTLEALRSYLDSVGLADMYDSVVSSDPSGTLRITGELNSNAAAMPLPEKI